MSTPKMSTAKSLKKSLDNEIKQYLQEQNVAGISQLTLSKAILSKYNQTTLAQYNIIINNSGKTVTVTKVTKATDKIVSGVTGFFAPTLETVGFPKFGSKESKVMIMEGKLKEVIKFHIIRGHPMEYDECLACKSIRAFVQFEFHQKHQDGPPKKKMGKKYQSSTSGNILKVATSSKVGVQSIVVAQPGQASVTHDKIDQVTTCSTVYAGFKEAQCNCGQIIITWNMKPTPVITPAEMNMIMIKKHDELEADAASFMKAEDELLFEEESDGIN